MNTIPFAGRAKDLGPAAVFMNLVLAAFVWLAIYCKQPSRLARASRVTEAAGMAN